MQFDRITIDMRMDRNTETVLGDAKEEARDAWRARRLISTPTSRRMPPALHRIRKKDVHSANVMMNKLALFYTRDEYAECIARTLRFCH